MSDAKDLVMKQFGGAGDAYVRSELHASGADLNRMLTLARPQGTERMLDIATGGGHVARAISPLVRQVTASDLTPEILGHARDAFEKWGLTNASIAVADAEALPFANASFEIITCRIAPHHFPNPNAFVGEVARVLTPGGQLLLIDSTVPQGIDGEWFNVVEKVRDHSHVRSLAVEDWTDLIRLHGLQLQEVESFPKRHDFDDWLERSRTSNDDRVELLHFFRQATSTQREEFLIEYRENGDVLAFTDMKTLFHAIKLQS